MAAERSEVAVQAAGTEGDAAHSAHQGAQWRLARYGSLPWLVERPVAIDTDPKTPVTDLTSDVRFEDVCAPYEPVPAGWRPSWPSRLPLSSRPA